MIFIGHFVMGRAIKMSKYQFDGFIAQRDDPDYVARNILKFAKHWVSEKEYQGSQLTKKVHVIIELQEGHDDKRRNI